MDTAATITALERSFTNKDHCVESDLHELWPDPTALVKSTDALPKITIEDINQITPPLLARWIKNISDRIAVGYEFVGAVIFGMLGGLSGRRFAIRPKKLDDWEIFMCCLWTVISAPPGSKKSAIFTKIMKALHTLEDRATEDFNSKFHEQRAKIKIIEIKKKELEKQIEKKIKSAGGIDEQASMNFATALAKLNKDEADAKIKQIRYMTSDATPAKMIEMLADNPAGMTIYNDEIESLLQSLDQNGNEVLRPLLLEAREGTGGKTQDRVGAGTRRANAIALCVLGGTQPDKLARRVTESEDGLIQRFGIMLSMPEAEFNDRDLAPDVAAFNEIMKFCEAIAFTGTDQPVSIVFSDSTRARFSQWALENHQMATHYSTRVSLKAHVSKYPSLVGALAGLFHIANIFGSTGSLSNLGEIDDRCFNWAAEWIESVFLPHAKYIYERNYAQTAAEKLSLRIRAGDVKDGMTVRALERKGWECLSNKILVQGALDELEDVGWLKVEEVRKDGKGRPSQVIRLNPKLQIDVQNA